MQGAAMTAPTAEVERVAAALDDVLLISVNGQLKRVADEAAALLRSLAKDAARLQLALATERGKLEKADAVADQWARDAARLDFVLAKCAFLTTMKADGGNTVYQLMTQDEDENFVELSGWHMEQREAIDRAIEAAGRKEGES
jgi:NAD(P)-dependent dehydrogenase (short-subunit alcohol dehydrogenase family)